MIIDNTHACCFTGHRPDKIKGTEDTIRTRLSEEIKKAIENGITTFISGMAEGVDTLAAEEVLKVQAEYRDTKLVCAVPFPGFEKNRPPENRQRFASILSKADQVIYICPKYCAWCFSARDKWMVDHAKVVIAVFNGSPGGTKRTLDYAKKNNRDIALILDKG